MSSSFYEDNKGGDILEIIDHEDGRYTFSVGNCCVHVFEKTGTISEITRWLTEISFLLPNHFEAVERV